MPLIKKSGSNLYVLLLICLFIFLMSCSSAPPEPAPLETEPADVPEAVEPEAETEPEDEQEELLIEDHFKVSEAVYNKTFSDIESLINILNQTITSSKFTEWKKYLTADYLEYYSDTENLKKVSDNPILKKYNIVLRSLNDYFKYVVVPSRSDVQLDEISFADDNKVIAYMIIDGDPVVLYTLVNIDGQWKIGL